MTAAGFVVTPAAQSDLDSIQDYLLEQSVDASRIVGAEIAQSLARLAEFPQAGHTRADLTERPVRFWSVFSYLIVYDPASNPIRILRIIHTSRDVRTVPL